MSSWSFKPPWWATLAVLVLTPCLCALGAWQLQRGWDKKALQAGYEQAQHAEPRELDAAAVGQPAHFERAHARGRFDAQRQLLLDNQSFDRKAGHHVLTPLLLEGGGIVMVNRGWIARIDAAAPPLPAVEGEVEVEGLWRALPQPGIRLAVDNCTGDTWPRLVQYPVVEDLRCLYGTEQVADGLLLLPPEAPLGYVRQWQQVEAAAPAKHYSYAAQWFAFAFTLVAIYFVMNLRRTP